MRIFLTIDEGLPHAVQTGYDPDADKVSGLQRSIKQLVVNKDTKACKPHEILIYPLGTTLHNYEDITPLNPEDKLPKHSTTQKSIFAHVPREKQNLSSLQRRMHSVPADMPKSKPEIWCVTVRCSNGNQFKAVINPAHRIKNLKRQFEDESGIPAEIQSLLLDGEELQDKLSAKNAGVQNGDTLDMDANSWFVHVRPPSGVTFPVQLMPSNTIGYIKEKAVPETGIDITQQVLKFHGKELSDGKTAGEIGLYDGSIVDLELAQFQVYVKTPDGKTWAIPMEPTDTIHSIKEQVAPKAKMDVALQILSFNGEELFDTQTAEESGLTHGSVLDLELDQFVVYVRTSDGTTYDVPMEPSDTIESIKEQVASKIQMEVEKQLLSYNGRELFNSQTAESAGLTNGAVLDVELDQFVVHVRTTDGRTFDVPIEPTDTIESIKEQVAPAVEMEVAEQLLSYNGKELDNSQTAEEAGINNGAVLDVAPASFQVFVRTPDGVGIPVTLLPLDKIQDIKRQVEPDTGLPPAEQVLTFNGEELANDQTAADAGLKNGSVLELEREPFEIFVRTPETTISVVIEPFDTIHFIKEESAAATGIDMPQQVLKFNGEELEDGQTATDYNIQPGSVLDLERKIMKVHVRSPDGPTVTLRIKPTDKVEVIKEKTASATGIDVPDQILKHNGTILPDGKTADEMGIEDGTVLDLEEKSLQILVRAPDQSIIPVTIEPIGTVRQIKETVEPEVGIAVTQQILVYNEKELTDEQTAEQLGLKNGSILDLEELMMEILVKTPDGTMIGVPTIPTDTIQFIKETIEPEVGIEVPQQVLRFNGEELPNDGTVQDFGMKDGSTLDLEQKPLEVYVRTPDGNTIPVQIKPSDTVELIKKLVAKPSGIEVAKQSLQYDGQELPNDVTAEELGLQDGSVLDLAEAYTPTPLNMSLLQCYYQLGDTVPYYIRINEYENVGVLKEKILETRSGRTCPYLTGITDASELQVYAAENDETLRPLGPDDSVPNHTGFGTPLIVVREDQ